MTVGSSPTDDRRVAPGERDISADPAAAVGSHPHRRHNPLRDEWILVSAERTRRPWQGREEPPPEQLPEYDPACYLCPGNARANGDTNPDYSTNFVFTNDFAALEPGTPEERFETGLLRAQGETGTCRVICFSRRHDLTLGSMSPADVRGVVDLWVDQTTELGGGFRWVQIFENRGSSMGGSNPHPHGQIWAGTALPSEARVEDTTQRRHWREHGERLLLDYVRQENGSPRVVDETDQWVVVVPFWAAWPYETLLIARHPVRRLAELSEQGRDELATVLVRVVRGYDGLFGRPFPYSMGWHQAPFGDGDRRHWQLHAHFYPPLLQANVRKHMVGYELLAEMQRDITPERAAERLRAALNRA